MPMAVGISSAPGTSISSWVAPAFQHGPRAGELRLGDIAV
jgi:hypothetical protein